MTEVNEQIKEAKQQVETKEKKQKKHFPILLMLLGIPVLCVLAAYAGGFCYYQKHFVRGTMIDQVDVSGMTIPELEAQIQEYSLKVLQRQASGGLLQEEIEGKAIGLSYSSIEPFQEILQEQNTWLWFLRQDTVHETEELIQYDMDALETEIGNLSGFKKDFAVAPTDAYIADYTPEQGFEVVEEIQGNQLNRQKALKAISEGVEELKEEVNLEEMDCYEKPKITVESEELKAASDKLQSYVGTTITYTFGDNKEVLDGTTISNWIEMDGFDVSIDKTQVEEYVATLRKTYDTVFRPRKFKTSYGTEVTINKGDYGWWMNTDQEIEELYDMIERGESGERTPVYRQTAASYDEQDYGNTYVEINLTAQHLFLYKDGKKILESDFVSGNASRGYDTPGGIYGLTYKQRDATLVGETYRTPVSYWMPFNNNIGMHDATWRREFGGDIYKTNGSHGCVNLPYSVAKEIYGYIEKGTPVICYYLPGTEPVPVVETPQEPTDQEAAQQGEEVPQEVPNPEPEPQPEEVSVPEEPVQPEETPVNPEPESQPQEASPESQGEENPG
ncbi:MAG: L,D-transpeptidase family protein [Lachnospiraceae bacterium]|nr:L,D-transpeptidase family protein [Lachnospiraceae bacterium]